MDIFELSFGAFFFLFIFEWVEICIFIFIFLEKKLFLLTKSIKIAIKKARWIGKVIFFIIGYCLMIIELIPNILAIILAGIISFFQYIADKDLSYKKCFIRKFLG